MCFNISGTSKFPAAQTIVRKEKTPPVLLRETLAYGTKHGMGVFCLFNTGEEQIGWVPEKDQKLLEDVRKAFPPGGGGGGLPYESDGDARRKIRINTLKETNLGVAPALFNP